MKSYISFNGFVLLYRIDEFHPSVSQAFFHICLGKVYFLREGLIQAADKKVCFSDKFQRHVTQLAKNLVRKHSDFLKKVPNLS